MEDPRLHRLSTGVPPPERFTNPFGHEPHPLCVQAAGEVERRVLGNGAWLGELSRGKMLGVLVVGMPGGGLGYLAAYSGFLQAQDDSDFFVPPVLDFMAPDGHFRRTEALIGGMGSRIDAIMGSEGYVSALGALERARKAMEADLEAHRRRMREAKALRDVRRRCPDSLAPGELEAMARESQFMRAELGRLRKRHEGIVGEAEGKLGAFMEEISRLKEERREMSDGLQEWLFGNYVMLNARGEGRDLLSIFAQTPWGAPPAGAGDCCGPKLLQYAYTRGYRPLCMAEFWWGESPRTEIRRHLAFYPACRGKCLPILSHMLGGLDVDEPSLGPRAVCAPPVVVYEDAFLLAVDKPPGMKTVRGKDGRGSLEEALAESGRETFIVHRLDMDTSGIVLVAKTRDACAGLRAQFAERKVSKRYVALLAGVPDAPDRGTIELPLWADPLDRPYQKVDPRGKAAVTDYEVVSRAGGLARVTLFPRTGRTHQIRVHCAHPDGLGVPILGDRLYGQAGDRLYLHAESVRFMHPVENKEMEIRRKGGF